MAGLQRLLKLYGQVTAHDGGKRVVWVWDYANDKPRIKGEMTNEQLIASEKARWSKINTEHQ